MVKDAWRFDKSQATLKNTIAALLVLATITLYVLELTPPATCTDMLLLTFGLVYVARLYFAMLVLWPRPVDWHEIPIVYMAFLPGIFYTMIKGRAAVDECGATSAAAALLYALGSALSTVSEYQRYVFKKDPSNKGKLMTGGLWVRRSVECDSSTGVEGKTPHTQAYSMHMNYFGDSLLFTGWTLASAGFAVWWAWWVPVVVTVLFIVMHIPGLDEYLADRYPTEFPDYAAKTSKFIPYVY